MKSILSLAAIAAVAYADADATAKAAVADVNNTGKDIAPLTKAIPRPDVALETGGKAKATLKQSTGIRITTGTDAQTYFEYLMEVAPAADFQKNKSFIDLVFAASKTAAKIDYTQWYTSEMSGQPIVNYKYAVLDRTMTSLESDHTLTAAETGQLKSYFYTKFGDIIKAGNAAVDENYWDAKASSSSVGTDGSLKLVLERKQPGVEELKVGGAALVYLKFKDDDGTQTFPSAYVKWANDAEPASEDSAFAVSTAAVAVAAIAALF